MSPFPSFLGGNNRHQDEPADPVEPVFEPESAPQADDDRPVFDLLPPQPVEEDAVEVELADQASAEIEPPPPPLGRNVHSIGISDIGRIAIDNDGRLYWDGKPVEVRRRILMSRRQVLGVTLIAIFVVIGALGAALQGAAAARDWACRLGWSGSYCEPSITPRKPEIPA
jgi:hypothetical protein